MRYVTINTEISPFKLEGCQCRLKFHPEEIQRTPDETIRNRITKQSKLLDAINGNLTIDGSFIEIDEGNFALHFMLAFLGKAWIAGQFRVTNNGSTLIDEPFRISNTFAAFSGGKTQLKGNAKYLGEQIVKRTIKAIRNA